jgi:HPt (histidine-containing phosphotransfer) domain-containing protein
MDVQMPVLDGHAATGRIRLDLRLGDLPIIALTAGAWSTDRPKALAAGMNDLIIKPFDPQRLVQSVRRHACLASPAGAGTIPEAAVSAPSCAGSWPEIDGIDSAAARERFCGDAALFRSLLGRMLNEFADSGLSDLSEHPAERAFAGRIHKLKGCAGTLGAHAIHRLASLVEEACTGGDVLEIRQLTAQLVSGLRQLRDAAATPLETASSDESAAASSGKSAAASSAREPGAAAASSEREPGAAAASSEREPGAAAAERVLGANELGNLARMLRLQTQSSIDLFHSLEPQLRQRLGMGPFELLREQVDSLEFGAAATVIEGC